RSLLAVPIAGDRSAQSATISAACLFSSPRKHTVRPDARDALPTQVRFETVPNSQNIWFVPAIEIRRSTPPPTGTAASEGTKRVSLEPSDFAAESSAFRDAYSASMVGNLPLPRGAMVGFSGCNGSLDFIAISRSVEGGCAAARGI